MAISSKAQKERGLSKEDKRALLQAWRENHDTAARDTLLGSYEPLILAQVAKYRSYKFPPEILITEAKLALYDAEASFDLGRGVRFGAVAKKKIGWRIQDYVARHWSPWKSFTSKRAKRVFFKKSKILKAADRYGNLTDEAAETLAAELSTNFVKITPRYLRIMVPYLLRVDMVSIQASIGGRTVEETLIDHSAHDAEAGLIQEEKMAARSQLLEDALAQLNRRQRYVFEARRLTVPPKAFEVIGNELAAISDGLTPGRPVSKQRVEQIDNRAFEIVQESILRAAGRKPQRTDSRTPGRKRSSSPEA